MQPVTLNSSRLDAGSLTNGWLYTILIGQSSCALPVQLLGLDYPTCRLCGAILMLASFLRNDSQ